MLCDSVDYCSESMKTSYMVTKEGVAALSSMYAFINERVYIFDSRKHLLQGH